MTALIEPNPGPTVRGSVHAADSATVEISGVAWPRYKVAAVLAAVVAGAIAIVATGSPQVTAWTSAAVLLAVWWGERYRATARGSNPPGIS